MQVLHINTTADSLLVDKFIKEGKDIFILVHMDGCGPCEATLPEWLKLEHTLKGAYGKDDRLIIIDMNMKFLSNVHLIGSIDGFPTLKFISNKGKNVETYEDSNIAQKNRSTDSFVSWVDEKMRKVVVNGGRGTPESLYRRLGRSLRRGKSRGAKKKGGKSRGAKKKGGKSRGAKRI